VKHIAEAKPDQVQAVFGDAKTAKQVHNAAKRVLSKKRTAQPEDAESPKKKPRKSAFELPNADINKDSLEDSLALPPFETDEQTLLDTTLICNRAPVVLAFGVVLLQYTMPEQPLSSRLSLAQAVVSMNSRSKAVSLGLEKGKGAEDEGWGAGQHVVKVMGRDVRTMKRAGWEQPAQTQGSDATIRQEEAEQVTALWALDLEALKRTEGGVNDGTGVGLSAGLPIYTPQSARSYLLKAFDRKTEETEKKKGKGSASTEKEKNLSMLLGALDMLFKSWSGSISPSELDNKAWHWYVQVRPTVPDGIQGWGAKGELKLRDIMRLKK
jgi:hypothetical protein